MPTRNEFFFLYFALVSTRTTTAGVIAFHAYMSKGSEVPLPTHHILQFDVVLLNRGNGYNAFDGIFVVPATGTYVFTWSFMSWPHGWVYTELMKNADVIGTRYSESDSPSAWVFFFRYCCFLMFPVVTMYTYAWGEPLMVELQVSVKAELRFLGGY